MPWINSEKFKNIHARERNKQLLGKKKKKKQQSSFGLLGRVFVFFKPKGDGGCIGPAYGVQEKLMSADVQAALGTGAWPSLPIQSHAPHRVTKHWQKYRSHPSTGSLRLAPRCSGLRSIVSSRLDAARKPLCSCGMHSPLQGVGLSLFSFFLRNWHGR